jgi:Cysteine rich repeat
MTIIKAITIAVFTAASFSSAAQAQGNGRLAACKDDIQKFCASEPRGQGKVRACLQSNKDKVSADCKTALDAAK